MSNIKTRVAPSPTWFVHTGFIRQVLHNYLFAKKNGGTFLLRIEDTDQNRKVEGATKFLINTMKSFGMDYDEGPDKNGWNGPYFQSERLTIYKKYIDRLVNAGQAYYCFCTTERLNTLRKNQIKNKVPTRYDRHCRQLTPEEIKQKLNNNEKYVIRLKVPDHQIIEFNDLIAGNIKINSNEIDDQILWKADGFPTYFGAIIDDHLMGITHVIRGNEWLTSTPKQILIYEALGFPLPIFAHPGNVLKEGGKKMSKRDGDASIMNLLKKWYLVETLINFLALTGWNPGTTEEFFTLEQLVKVFDINRVHKAGAFFDKEKLNWMNWEYLKRMPNNEYLTKLKAFIAEYQPDFEQQLTTFSDDFFQKIAFELKTRLTTLADFQKLTTYFFNNNYHYNLDLFINLKMKINTVQDVISFLEFGVSVLTNITKEDWHINNIKEIFLEKIKENGHKNGQILWPLRVALSAERFSPGAFELAYIFGKTKSLKKIEQALNFLKS